VKSSGKSTDNSFIKQANENQCASFFLKCHVIDNESKECFLYLIASLWILSFYLDKNIQVLSSDFYIFFNTIGKIFNNAFLLFLREEKGKVKSYDNL
jgi:hypothetical protein